MGKAVKKIAGGIFLLSGVLPVLFVVSFYIRKQVIYHQMKEKLETGILQKIVIPEKDVIWMEKHEVWVNDQMFDIKTFVLENGIYTFTGLYDKEETLLIREFEDTGGKKKEETQLLERLFKSLQSITCTNTAGTSCYTLNTEYLNVWAYGLLHKPFRLILTPPPRAFC